MSRPAGRSEDSGVPRDDASTAAPDGFLIGAMPTVTLIRHDLGADPLRAAAGRGPCPRVHAATTTTGVPGMSRRAARPTSGAQVVIGATIGADGPRSCGGPWVLACPALSLVVVSSGESPLHTPAIPGTAVRKFNATAGSMACLGKEPCGTHRATSTAARSGAGLQTPPPAALSSSGPSVGSALRDVPCRGAQASPCHRR